ncbi:MAG: protein arginine kinase [Sporanaerobacter sp.]|jgi:protein arginine kinase|uniref:protein arginine kinase n=1 Tax=Sporanaerobacter sp. TaxID=2010183 RepID=UPI003A103A82
MRWLDDSGAENDVVISSRVRIARNLENFKFPQIMSRQEAEDISLKILNVAKKTDSFNDYKFYRLNDLSVLEKNVFIEEHLISPNLVQNQEKASFLLKNDESVTIMINEEDHLRIQCLSSGLNLEELWSTANNIDDILEESLDFAFDEKFGYLTSCPTNTGTGMRASVMIHLPSLVFTGYMNNIYQALSQIGLTVRGLYGEGTSALGNIFQISNQTTLGETEEEIIQKLKNVIIQIADKEREVRNKLLNTRQIEIEDKVFRSMGTLKYSRILSSKEAMSLLSDVKMGIEMGIIKDIQSKEINKLMILIQPASLQKYFGTDLTAENRDIKRAELIRERI